LRTIKLIRAIRVCRTAALGGHLLTCPDCGAAKYRYFSCGHSHCPICQGNKRKAWYERVETRLLEVPYTHVTFTLPHELNGICRLHPRVLYGMLFRTAWQTLLELCADKTRVGGLPGMTGVLHTWGSDLKHHVHVHCLVTFGGLDEGGGRWCWPKVKGKLLGHRVLRNTFRRNFLANLRTWMTEMGSGVYHQSFGVLTADLYAKSWVVNQQPPMVDADLINAYLSRYICRIGISDQRVQYDATTQRVSITYKDYRRQQKGEAAPTALLELPPLVAMQKILQHVLPSGFHRTRSYGLHAPNTRKRLGPKLEQYVKAARSTVLVVLRLLKVFLQLQLGPACEQCGSMTPPSKVVVTPDRHYITPWLIGNERAPPNAPTTAPSTSMAA
jgi:hypothetical protein